MSSKTPVIAVFDIGRTNKKVFLWDTAFQVRAWVMQMPWARRLGKRGQVGFQLGKRTGPAHAHAFVAGVKGGGLFRRGFKGQPLQI